MRVKLENSKSICNFSSLCIN